MSSDKQVGLITENDRIPPQALAVLLVITIAEINFLAVPRSLAEVAGRDAWISTILGFILVGSCFWLMYEISRRFPDKTLVEIAQHVLGQAAWDRRHLVFHHVLAGSCGLAARSAKPHVYPAAAAGNAQVDFERLHVAIERLLGKAWHRADGAAFYHVFGKLRRRCRGRIFVSDCVSLEPGRILPVLSDGLCRC